MEPRHFSCSIHLTSLADQVPSTTAVQGAGGDRTGCAGGRIGRRGGGHRDVRHGPSRQRTHRSRRERPQGVPSGRPGAATLAGTEAGLHILVWLNGIPRAAEEGLVLRAAKAGLGIYPIGPLYDGSGRAAPPAWVVLSSVMPLSPWAAWRRGSRCWPN